MLSGNRAISPEQCWAIDHVKAEITITWIPTSSPTPAQHWVQSGYGELAHLPPTTLPTKIGMFWTRAGGLQPGEVELTGRNYNVYCAGTLNHWPVPAARPDTPSYKNVTHTWNIYENISQACLVRHLINAMEKILRPVSCLP